MNTIARVMFPVLLAVSAYNSSASALTLLPAGDCQAMMSNGTGPVWEGRFSGKMMSSEADFHPVSAVGCFKTEYACRRWVSNVATQAELAGLMTCRQIR